MANAAYFQLSVKFPMGRERYRQAIDLILERDKGKYPTQADYLAAAILAFEGKISDERTSLSQIMEAVLQVKEKVEELSDGSQKSGQPS